MKLRTRFLSLFVFITLVNNPLFAYQAPLNVDSLRQQAQILALYEDFSSALDLFDVAIAEYNKLGKKKKMLFTAFDKGMFIAYREDLSPDERLQKITSLYQNHKTPKVKELYPSLQFYFSALTNPLENSFEAYQKIAKHLDDNKMHGIIVKLSANLAFSHYQWMRSTKPWNTSNWPKKPNSNALM